MRKLNTAQIYGHHKAPGPPRTTEPSTFLHWSIRIWWAKASGLDVSFQSWRESPKWIYAGIPELATFCPYPMMLLVLPPGSRPSLPQQPSPLACCSAAAVSFPFLWIQARKEGPCSYTIYAHRHHHVLSRAMRGAITLTGCVQNKNIFSRSKK